MPLPDVDSLASLGGALNNYGVGVLDPTVDRDAAGANPAYADVAAMTHTIMRAWVRFTLNGTATPVLVAHDANWGNAITVQPTLARTTTGTYTSTWPVTVNDEIPSGAPGYVNPHTVNIRAGFANIRVGSAAFDVFVIPTSANVVTVKVFNTSGSLADPGSATDVDVWVM